MLHGYVPSNKPKNNSVKQLDISSILNKYLNLAAVATKNNILIKIASTDIVNSIEFARILSSALDTELNSRSYTYVDNDNVEVQCDIVGDKDNCLNAVKSIAAGVEEAFEFATSKFDNIYVSTNFEVNKSNYEPISLKTALNNYRKFLIKVEGK